LEPLVELLLIVRSSTAVCSALMIRPGTWVICS